MSDKLSFTERYAIAYAAMSNPPLDSVNPHYNSKFSSLAATLSAIRKPCAENGIIYRQLVGEVAGTLLLVSSIVDAYSGETMPLSAFPIKFDPNPQKFGSQLTYTKRQQAQADWALVGEQDDDGEAAAKAQQQAQQQAPVAAQAQRDYSALRRECERLAAIHEVSVNDEYRWVVDTYGNPKEMTDEGYEALVSILSHMEVD